MRSLLKLYKSLNDSPLHEQEAPPKTYGDLSPEEWEAEREKIGMKTDDEGNQYIDNEYDSGNEPLEIQMNPDQGVNANKIFYIEPEDIEDYVSGEDVVAHNPGEIDSDEVTANEKNSDVTSQGEKEIERLYGVGVDDVRQAYKDEADPIGFLSNLDLTSINEYDTEAADDNENDDIKGQPFPAVGENVNEYGCSEQEIEEGTCGHAPDGAIDIHNTDRMKPAGSHLLKISLSEVKRLKKLANIK